LAQAPVTLDDFNQVELRSLADRLLETTRVEYVNKGLLIVMNPRGFEHRKILGSLDRAFYTALSADWHIYSEDFQWDLPDGNGPFYVPDMVVVPPGAETRGDERASIAFVAEVTSPDSPDTVLNDREIKPVEYAKAGIPLYLLVDQEPGRWTLHGLAEGWQRYQVAAAGKYGELAELPPPFGFAIQTADWPRIWD
jgi:Uma2 family endonuclease